MPSYTTDFVPFATGAGANVLTQANYLSASYLSTGFQSGIAPSAGYNKAHRQSTFVAAGLTQWLANAQGANVVDDGNLPNLVNLLGAAFQVQASNYASDTGAVNALAVTLNPAPASLAALTGAPLRVKVANTNTGAATLSVNGKSAPIVDRSGSAMIAGALLVGDIATFVYNGSSFVYQPSTGRLLNVQVFTASGTYTPTPGTQKVRATVVGGGGSGGGVAAPTSGNSAGADGGGAGSSIQVIVPSGFSGATVTVGTGGAAPTGGAAGNPGGASSFGAFATAPGGPAGSYNGASSPGGWISDGAPSAAPTFSGSSLIFSARGGGGGGSCSYNSALSPRGGNGGASLFGAGAGGSANGAGFAALNYGAGGSGASANSGSGPFNGGAGMGGIIIIEEFA